MITQRPLKELKAETAEMQRAKPNQLFASLLQLKGGWSANHALLQANPAIAFRTSFGAPERVHRPEIGCKLLGLLRSAAKGIFRRTEAVIRLEGESVTPDGIWKSVLAQRGGDL